MSLLLSKSINQEAIPQEASKPFKSVNIWIYVIQLSIDTKQSIVRCILGEEFENSVLRLNSRNLQTIEIEAISDNYEGDSSMESGFILRNIWNYFCTNSLFIWR